MTTAQGAAYIVAQAALLSADVARMQAENEHRSNLGHGVAYADEEFQTVIEDRGGVLEHNSVMTLFNACSP